MNFNFAIIACLLLSASCGRNKQTPPSESSASEPSVQTTQLCFQHTTGSKNQDSSTIQLFIRGNEVNGNFNHMPFEKDSRKGTIAGTRIGDIIKALWSFSQEGINDTLPVEFKLSENELLQKTFGTDKNTGRQKLTDTSTFSIRYQKVDCGNMNSN